MRNAVLITGLMVLSAVVIGAGIHHAQKARRKAEAPEWALPAVAGEQLIADLSKELLPPRFQAEEQSAGTEEAPMAQVGEIQVIGNERTHLSVILEHVNLYPGQVLCPSDLRAAERSLAASGLFVVDPGRGIRPTLEVVDTGSSFKNIVIRVQEK